MNQDDLEFFRKLIKSKIGQTNEDVAAIEKTSRNGGDETASEDR